MEAGVGARLRHRRHRIPPHRRTRCDYDRLQAPPAGTGILTMREVAVVGFRTAPHVRRTQGTTNGVEMLMPCFAELYAELGDRPTATRLPVPRFVGLPLSAPFRSFRRSTRSAPFRSINESHVGWTRRGPRTGGTSLIPDRRRSTPHSSTVSVISAGAHCAAYWPCRPTPTPSRRSGLTLCPWPPGRAHRVGLRKMDRRTDGAGGAGHVRRGRAHGRWKGATSVG